MVHPDYRSQGIGGQLIEARYNLIRALNLRGLVAGSMIVDYGKVADQISAAQYVREVVAGLRFDSNLSKQLRKGFKVYGLIPNYTIDMNSRGWAAEIVWVNPDYRPARRIHVIPTPRHAALLPRSLGRAPLLQGI